MLAAIRRSGKERPDILHDQLLGGLIARHDVRSAPDAHGQLKARVHLVGTRGENDQVIDGNLRSLLESYAHDRPSIPEFRGALTRQQLRPLPTTTATGFPVMGSRQSTWASARRCIASS